MAERTQNINSSPSVSSITNNDDIFVSQNGATLAKIDYNLLAKAIIEQYTGSTLAGSAQAVKTALDTLNSNLTDIRGVSINTGVPDILAWALTIDGFGTCRTSPGTTNLPSAAGNSYGIAICEAWNRTTDNKWDRLFWFPTTTRDIWVNSKTNTADWLGWQKLPTREEINDAYRLGSGMVEIPQNANLNTYKTFGEYVCSYNANVASITNKPSTLDRAFRLRVETALSSTAYIRQIIFAYNTSDIYTRYSTDTGSTWSTWITMNYVVNDSFNSGNLFDYITPLPKGVYTTRIDGATNAPISGGVVYHIVKTNGANDTRCQIEAFPMNASNPDVYTAFIPASATTITWQKMPTRAEINSALKYRSDYNSITKDFNSFPDNTYFWVNNGSGTYSNAPGNIAGLAITMPEASTTHKMQIFIQHNAQTVYLRSMADSTWGAWRKIATTAV